MLETGLLPFSRTTRENVTPGVLETQPAGMELTSGSEEVRCRFGIGSDFR